MFEFVSISHRVGLQDVNMFYDEIIIIVSISHRVGLQQYLLCFLIIPHETSPVKPFFSWSLSFFRPPFFLILLNSSN